MPIKIVGVVLTEAHPSTFPCSLPFISSVLSGTQKGLHGESSKVCGAKFPECVKNIIVILMISEVG